MTELMNEMNAQMETVPAAVQAWMNWMMAIFLASVFFVWKHKNARYALGAFILTAPLAMLCFSLTRNVHLLGFVHFVAWLPLLILLVKREIRTSGFNAKSPYGVWVILLCATIAVCLLFDVRDIMLVAMGKKV